MRKTILLFSLCFSFLAEAQVKIPQLSVKAKVEQTVGLTELSVQYNRPAKRKRVIFGDLVPFNKMWRTGANENTILTISEDVLIDEKLLPKGKYSIFTKPNPKQWEVYFYSDTNNWGLPREWNEEKVALKILVEPFVYSVDSEYFTVDITPFNSTDGAIGIRWDNTAISIPFKTFAHKQAMESINNSLSQTSTARDYYDAGSYLYNSDGNMQKALEYVNKSLEMQEDAPFYMLRQKSLILAKLNRKKEAIEVANISLEKAKKAKNDDYVKMNQQSIAQWKKEI